MRTLNAMRLLGWLGVLAGCCGCGNEDADRLSRVFSKVAAGVQAQSAPARGKLLHGWDALRGQRSTLGSIVAARLQNDKALVGLRIEVQVTGNVVELKGQAEENQRRRAVELAGATVGVERVVDGLGVNAE